MSTSPSKPPVSREACRGERPGTPERLVHRTRDSSDSRTVHDRRILLILYTVAVMMVLPGTQTMETSTGIRRPARSAMPACCPRKADSISARENSLQGPSAALPADTNYSA